MGDIAFITDKAVFFEFYDGLASFENSECRLQIAKFVDILSFGKDGMSANNDEYSSSS